MKELVNLTNHSVKIITPNGVREIKPSGQIARVSYKIETIDEIDGIPIVEIKYNDVVGLPDKKENTYYIVSSIVKNAVGMSRPDVLTLYGVKRHNGEPYACEGFRVNG